MANKLAIAFMWTCGISAVFTAASAVIVGWQLALTVTIMLLGGIPAARTLLVICGRERLFARLEEHQLPRAFRRFLNEASPEMERLGLEPVGDFLIYPQPIALHSRGFRGDAGRCFGYLARRTGKTYYGFLTAFADGTYLESSPMSPLRVAPDDDAPLRFAYCPNASMEKLLKFHREQVERIETERETRAMSFDADQYADVSEYGFRLSDWDLYQKGHRWIRPQSVSERAAELQNVELAS